MGEITLKSNLGESLLAKVALTDVDGTPESNCFSASDISDTPAFKKATVALQNTNGNYQLNITTHEAITEPIINLRVAIHCEPNLNRDYVLLLDPVSLASPDISAITGQQTTVSNSPPVNGNSHQRKSNQQVVRQNGTDLLLENAIKNGSGKKNKLKKKTRQKLSTESSADMKLLEAYTGKPTAENSSKPTTENKAGAKASNTQDTAGKPRLIISGGNTNSAEGAKSPSLSLRLETQIDFARSETAAPLNSADTADEVTMMTNRLAHLEKQIISLQGQNERLRDEAQKTKNFSLLPAQLLSWWPSLPIMLGTLAALAGAIWLRRKILSKRLLDEEARWFDAGNDTELSDDFSEYNSLKSDTANFDKIKPTKTTSSQPNNGNASNQTQSGFFSYPSAYTVDDNDVSESVLDHSDVFIAHGRPAMAIQLLQNHLIDSPVESPEIWLKLLSLLAAEGTETEYDNAVIACKKFFNIKLPSFIDAATIDDSTIEDYPHIVARLQEVWGSEFAVEFLNDLIFNRQSQPREGFGRSTFEELFLLNQIAVSLHTSNKFNRRADIKEPTKTQATVEISSVQQIMQDYGMSVDIEPQDHAVAPTPPQEPNHALDNELTAESFFNAPDVAESDPDMQLNAESAPDLGFGLDISFEENNFEEKSELEDKFKTAELNHHLNSPTLEINAPLNADEIDFSEFQNSINDEINIEAPTDITISQVTFPEAEEIQDLTIDIVEEHTEGDANDEPLNTLNMIEWEQPKSEPALKSQPKTKTKKEQLP